MKNQNNQNQDNQSVILEAVKGLKFQSRYELDKDNDRIKLEMHFDDMCEVTKMRTGLVDLLRLVGFLASNFEIDKMETVKLCEGIEAVAMVLNKSSDEWCISEPLTEIIKTPIE